MLNFKLKISFLAFFFLGIICSAQTSSAAIINATSCSITDVQTAVTTAVSGDTITIPAGTCTWTSGITTSKAIKIRGAGSKVLTIKPTGNFRPFSLNGCTESNNCEVSGVAIDNLNLQTDYTVSIWGTAYKKTFRVHDIKIINACGAGAGRGIYVEGTYGLIDNVDINKSNLTADCSFQSVTVKGKGFGELLRPAPFNSDELVIVENSKFDYCQGSGADGALDMYTGASVLERFNDYFCVGIGGHGYDSDYVGLYFLEAYANKFDASSLNYHMFEAIAYRSGTGAVHDNSVVYVPGQQNHNYDNLVQLRLYRPWSYGLGIWAGRGAADGNLEKFCDNSGIRHYVNVCEKDADCAPGYGLCRASLCRRTSDNMTLMADVNEYPLTCVSNDDCSAFVANGQLPAGSYMCDGTADGDRVPHPAGVSSGSATGQSANSLTVAGTPWSTNEWKWFFAYNDSDGSRCLVTSNINNTITCSGIEYARDKHTQAITGTLQGVISGATGTVVNYEDATEGGGFGRVVLSNVTGTFQLYENLQINCPTACETVGHAISGYGLFAGGDNTWQNNDNFHLTIGYPARNAPGIGRNNLLEPIYAWNNTFKNAIGGFIKIGYSDYGNSKILAENRDFFNTVKPGHADIICPDPRTGLSGSCDISVAGMAGYKVVNSDVTPPLAPNGLAIN